MHRKIMIFYAPANRFWNGLVRLRFAFCLLVATILFSADIQMALAAPPFPYLVADINVATPGSDPQGFVALNDVIYFHAEDRSGVRNLWKSDGTKGGTVLLKEMGVESLVRVGGTLFFVHGFTGELWKSDGTPAGTIMVKDLALELPGASLRGLIEFDGLLFLIVDGGNSGYGLWKSDGTAQGTTLVKQISPSAASTIVHWPTVVGDSLFFLGDNVFTGTELWKSDGTGLGTMLVKDIYPNSESSDPRELTAVGDTLFFTTDDGTSGRELWKSDGTATGTTRVKDINPDAASSNPRDLTAIGNTLYFSAFNDASGRELWESDGTDAGTMIVKDIISGAEEGFPENLVNVDSTLYFQASTNSKGAELWKSDGTDAGTKMVKDIEEGEEGSSPWQLIDVDGTLFFVAYTENRGEELWRSNGTSNGTVPVKDVNRRDDFGYFSGFTALGSMLVFRADDGTHGSEIWISNGSKSGTKMIKDLYSATRDSGAENLAAAQAQGGNGPLFFSAYQEETGRELWLSDGREAGTRMVKDIFGGSDSGYPSTVVYVNGIYYFSAVNGATGIELWKSDGTAEGTTLVRDIYDGVFDSAPTALTVVGNQLYFSASDGNTGKELWKSDGSKNGTMLVKDIYMNGDSANPSELTDVNGTLFFVADDGTNKALWKSDGTSNGTTRVQNFYPSDESPAHPYDLNRLGSKLLFWVNRSSDDNELWVSDGTPTGTRKLQSISADFGRGLNLAAVADNRLFFAPSATETNALWSSDGTASGTQLIKDFGLGANPLLIQSIHAVGAKAIVALSDGSSNAPQLELWQSDGTPAGTVLLKKISTGSGEPIPEDLTELNLQLFYALGGCDTGQEIWASDGTVEGTVLLADAIPNFEGRCIESLTKAGTNLFFSAKDAPHGEELWAINLGDPLPGKVILEKRAFPANSTTTFSFAGDFSGALRDREPFEIPNIVPGSYTISEGDATPSYYLYDMTCNDGNSLFPSTWDVATRQIMLNVDSGETIRCLSYSTVPGQIAVGKTPSVAEAEIGATVDYTYRVTNSGSVTLTNVMAVDDPLGPINLNVTTLAPGDSALGAKSYTVVEADLPGPIVNTVTVTGTALGGPLPTATATSSVAVMMTPDLSVVKTADVVIAAVDDVIQYTYQLRNNGDVALTNIVLNDEKIGSVSLTETVLAPGQEISGTKAYTVARTDLPGPLQSVAAASYKSNGESMESQTAGASVVLGNVIVIIDELRSGELTYVGPDGKRTMVAAPFGAVDQETSLLYRSVTTPAASDGTLQFAGKVFMLSAYQKGQPANGLTFTNPISLTIEYTDADVAGLDENLLNIRYFDTTSQQWRNDGIVIVERNIEENRIAATITHLTEFALWGMPPVAPPVDPPSATKKNLYLPLVARD